MCLFLCQYHAILITVALYYCLKSGRVMPPALFFFFRIAFAILDLLWFRINFRIMCSSSHRTDLSSEECSSENTGFLIFHLYNLSEKNKS